jgi:hypothetical protein
MSQDVHAATVMFMHQLVSRCFLCMEDRNEMCFFLHRKQTQIQLNIVGNHLISRRDINVDVNRRILDCFKGEYVSCSRLDGVMTLSITQELNKKLTSWLAQN